MTTATDVRDRWAQAFLSTYAAPDLLLVDGRGCEVVDVDGRTYLDLLAGIAVSSLGHGHPAIVEAVAAQVARVAHTSNLYANEPSLQLAERLQSLAGVPCRVFLCNDGATANEAAFKLARRHGDGRRPVIVAAENGFHGRTAAALSMTGQPAKRAPFEPLVPHVRFVPFGDAAALAAAVDDDVAAVVLEPIQGEGGVVVPPDGYLAAAREVCDARGALLVLDEVQTGIGRTGHWFAWQRDGVVPDAFTLAKGMAGGLPIGALVAVGDAADAFRPGDHGSTFGGNPVSAAAALAVLDVIEKESLLEHAAALGERFAASVAALGERRIAGTRGQGLLQAVALDGVSGQAVERAARARGFLVGALPDAAVRIAPPLVLTAEQLDTFVAALPGILNDAQQAERS